MLRKRRWFGVKILSAISLSLLTLAGIQIGSIDAASASYINPTVETSSLNVVAHPSVCLDADESDYGEVGDPLQLWGCSGNQGQTWFVQGNTLLSFETQRTSGDQLCLGASNTYGGHAFPTDNDPVELMLCDQSSPEQQWVLESNGNIQNSTYPSWCLDADSTNFPADGDAVQVFGCDQNPEQVWGDIDSYCQDTGNFHEFAEQFTADPSGNWWGESGNFDTTVLTVPNDNADENLDHLYMTTCFVCGPEIEVGFYVGEGLTESSDTQPYFYWEYNDSNGALVENDEGTPTIGTTYAYKLLYAGPDLGNGKSKWQVYWSNQSDTTIEVAGLPGGQPLAGAEVLANGGKDKVIVNTVGTPNWQLKDTSGNWSEWNTSSAPSHYCGDPGIDFTETSPYDNFSAEGAMNG